MKVSTIYLDAEDDITAIINKVKTATESIVAVIPPKRMMVLQSAINLKLLKKQAKKDDKKLVIITSEEALLPLAGSVGVHVAESLKSRPYLPDSPADEVDEELVINDELSTDHTPHVPVGILDKATKTAGSVGESPVKLREKPARLLNALPKIKNKIPNFNRFRLRLILAGIGLVVFGILWYIGYFVMPKATVTIEAQTTRVRSDFDFTLDNKIEADDLEKRILKTTIESLKKSASATIPTTGEKNVGEKAGGIMTIKNCDSSESVSVPSGTSFTSSTGKTFTSTTAATVPGGSFSGGGCDTPGQTTVAVIATQGGTSSNLVAGISYTVDGFSALITGTGAKMSGGTDEIARVVSQTDLDEAVENLKITNHDEAVAELELQFDIGLTPIAATLGVKQAEPKGTPAVGEEAEEVIVTLAYTYTMKAVATESLETLIKEELEEQIGSGGLQLFDNGLSTAILKMQDKTTVNIAVSSYIGPELDELEIAQEISGMKYGSASQLLESKPGVKDVTINLQPFWVFSLPKAEKITVSIEINQITPIQN